MKTYSIEDIVIPKDSIRRVKKMGEDAFEVELKSDITVTFKYKDKHTCAKNFKVLRCDFHGVEIK